MDRAIHLSIFVPTYRRPHAISRLLFEIAPSLDRLPKGTVELVISDNCSGIDYSFVNSYVRDNIHLFVANSNAGLRGNFLRAAHLCNGRYVLYLSDEDSLSLDCLKNVLSLINSESIGSTDVIQLGVLTQHRVALPSRAVHGGQDIGLLNWYETGYISGTIFLRNALNILKQCDVFFKSTNVYPVISAMAALGCSKIFLAGSLKIEMVQQLDTCISNELSGGKSHLSIDNKVGFVSNLVSSICWCLSSGILPTKCHQHYLGQWRILLKRIYREAFNPTHVDPADIELFRHLAIQNYRKS